MKTFVELFPAPINVECLLLALGWQKVIGGAPLSEQLWSAADWDLLERALRSISTEQALVLSREFVDSLAAEADGEARQSCFVAEYERLCAQIDKPSTVWPKRILSLGAGVQSTTLLRMSLAGELPPLDAVIFSDTGWEPLAVYEHLAVLQAECEAAGVPFYLVENGNIREKALAINSRFVALPVHLRNKAGEKGMLRRQCTNEFKILPIQRKIRELLGGKPRGKQVEQWMGISLDEVQRMRVSRVSYVKLAYPLIEKSMSRHDCLRWLVAHGFPHPPKSACIGCPFRSDREWREMQDARPDEFADAVNFDHALRDGTSKLGQKLNSDPFLHASLLPLDMVDLSTPADHGQLDMFDNECSGHCGV